MIQGRLLFTQAGSSRSEFFTSGDQAPSYNICMEADLLISLKDKEPIKALEEEKQVELKVRPEAEGP